MARKRQPGVQPKRDPEARSSIQTEADPIDRVLATRQIEEIRGIKIVLGSIDQTLKTISETLKTQGQAAVMSIDIGPVTIDRAQGAGERPMLTLTDEQKCTLSIQPVTAAGNPARVDGVPTWSSSNPAIVELDVAADGMSCVARTPGNLGTATVSCSADADLGSGVRELVALLDVEVVAAEAATMGIATGTPEIE